MAWKNRIFWKKSRREKTDEGVTYAENEGRRYGEISFCLLIIAVLVYDFAKGLDNYLPMSLLWAYLAAQALGKYQARRERRFLWGIVFGAVASLCFLLCYVLRTW